jgi:hypothetical protein
MPRDDPRILSFAAPLAAEAGAPGQGSGAVTRDAFATPAAASPVAARRHPNRLHGSRIPDIHRLSGACRDPA